ncbi:MAG: ABC transporter ATP-binding protein [Alphaproteobacteria bacterium]|nr:MAG: ABC transporter ATP-binding protein [Alphaproteobacteria bacterium]
MDEINKFSKRVARYANLGTSAGSIALKFLGTRLLNKEHEKNAEDLKNILGNLKGPIMKIAQLLSTVPDLLPEEYVNELTKLQSNAPPMGWNFVKRRMKNELGFDWLDSFDSFEKEPFAAASLGQVHRAVYKGENVVCKLQYPDMNSIVDADVNQLKLIFSIYKKIDSSIDTSEIQKEISVRIKEELEYKQEQKHIQLFNLIFNEFNEVRIPKVYKEISTNRLISMNFLPGNKLLHFKKYPHAIRQKIAKNMFTAWYYPFYKYGVIHGDPHLGNYSSDKNANINLLDFGCIRVFKPSFVKGVIDLYHAIKNNDTDLAIHAYESWGFENISKDLIDVLNIWAKFLYSPLMENKLRKMQDTNSSTYGAEAASKVHRELKKIGGVKPPREFVFMDRAAIGLGSVFLHLDAKLNWYKLFHELIDGFNEDSLKKRQRDAIKGVKMEYTF